MISVIIMIICLNSLLPWSLQKFKIGGDISNNTFHWKTIEGNPHLTIKRPHSKILLYTNEKNGQATFIPTKYYHIMILHYFGLRSIHLS